MNVRRSALGRGLGALIPDSPAPDVMVALSPGDAGTAVLEIPVDRIVPNPEQPRRRFVEAELDALAESIRRHGVLQPVLVRRRDGTEDGYELVVGERRWRAAQRAGLSRIPATLKDVASRERLEIALVENVQRRDLNPIELALAFRTLLEGDATQDEVGQRVGLDRSTVSNHLRLLDLPRDYQEDVEEGRLGVGHAKALLQVGNPVRRRELRDRILGDQLSVRAAEELARRTPGAATRRSPAAASVDPNLQGLVDALRDHLKTRVRIRGTARRGRIELDFYGPEDLQRLSDALLGGP